MFSYVVFSPLFLQGTIPIGRQEGMAEWNDGQDRTGHFIHLIVMYMNSKYDLRLFKRI